MWCDNCLLIFPLRGGLMALAAFIGLYSLIGGIILFKYGIFLYFTFPESQVYGGISMAIVAVAVISLFAASNSSLTWTRVCCFLSPIVLLVSLIRAGLMTFRLNAYSDNIAWECANGGQVYNATILNTAQPPTSLTAVMPTQFCTYGFHSLYLAFALSLCVDVILQGYLSFMLWRFKARIVKYFAFANNVGGIYTA